MQWQAANLILAYRWHRTDHAYKHTAIQVNTPALQDAQAMALAASPY